MDVFEAVDSRLSCRWFLDKPVDQAIVRDLIVKAQRAASGGNLQPWFVHALTGEPLADLKRTVAQRVENENPRLFKSEYPIYPDPAFGAYKERRAEHGVQLYGALGIGRDDAAGRLAQHKRNYVFFNAPVGLFVAIDRRLGPAQWADLGGYLQTFALLARGYGLDTCPQVSWARIYETVATFLKLPPEQMLFCGMAVGYCDRDHPANGFRSPRAELAEFCTFHGFAAE